MAFESITDDKLMDLINCPKKISNPHTRKRNLDGREQINYQAVATDDSGHEFAIYMRQNLREGMENDFSCGISWISTNGESLTLKRYNGSSHIHRNKLEKVHLQLGFHIHYATEKYIKSNQKPEGFAESTARYLTAKGALHCLVSDCNVTGIQTEVDIINQMELEFDEP